MKKSHTVGDAWREMSSLCAGSGSKSDAWLREIQRLIPGTGGVHVSFSTHTAIFP